MRALVVEQVQAQPEVRQVEVPTAPSDGVVVKVAATGMCRSDWHAWAGHDSDVTFPHVPGHELAGIITEVGPEVTRFTVGDRVTVPFISGCGACEWCASGNATVCPNQVQPGFDYWGSFAEYVVLHAADANVITLPDSVDFATAASLGCRFATSYRALVGRARVRPGEWVTVIGAGGVGLSAVMIAKALGANVIAVDRNAEALAVATELGADRTLVADGRDIPAAIAELTGGGSHVAVDAVGSEQTASDGILGLRRQGRHVQVGLLPPIAGHPRIPMARAIAWELDVLGSHGMAAVDYPEMLALIEQGRLEPQRLIERTIGLDELAELLPVFDRARVAGMTIVDPSR